MIICFSGTGNSRYIAKRIACALHDEILDLNAKIRARDFTPVRTGRDVIVVAPTYAWRLPRVVQEWISSTELLGAERIWFVMNCGAQIGNADAYNQKLAQQKHLAHKGTAQIVMPENYIALFEAPREKEARAIVARAEPCIERACECIAAGRDLDTPKSSVVDRMLSGPVNPAFYRLFVGAGDFRASESCTGCGLCARGCPCRVIEMEQGRPVWGSGCTHCMECICSCPCKAIEYGRKTANKFRYRFDRLGIAMPEDDAAR